MSERMSNADVGFLHRETRTSPQHVAAIMVLDTPPGGFDYERLVRLLEERISLAPRYRQKVRPIPGHLANPLWVDDPRFDITYHARRSALPRPGTDEQLFEFCARILSRLLDRSRPLWEMYLVEGLSGGRTAIITKTHAAMVGEPDGIDLAQVILDAAPAPRRTVEALWMPEAEPGPVTLLRDAVTGVLRRPRRLGETARSAVHDVQGVSTRATALVGGLVSAAGVLARRAPASPLQAQLSEQRRLAVARTRLEDFRRVRDAFGGTVNDVVLAVVSGALRGWLLARAAQPPPATTVRALVPVSVVDSGPGDATAVRPLLVDLPVGEPDPVLRLARVRYAMATHGASGRAVDAHTLTELAGFAPPTLHALGARAATELTRRMFSLVITNVPGPQLPLYAAGARLTEMFPISPLSPGQAISIALASYDGGVNFGVNGDWDAAPDVRLLASLLEEALAELVAATETGAVSAAGRSLRGAGPSPQPSPGRTDPPQRR